MGPQKLIRMGTRHMDGMTWGVWRDQHMRVILLLVCVGIGLLGYVAGSWLNSGEAPGIAARVQSAQRASATLSSPLTAEIGLSAVMLLVVTLLLFSAVALLLRGRHSSADDAMRDPTTRLYKRICMDEMVPALMARDDRAGISQMTLVMLRIDFLDDIRDRYGRPAADRVLEVLGRKVRSQTRAGDVPVRFDEQCLAVFLQCGEVEQAIAFGRRLGTLLAGEQLELGGDVIKITLSMGIAVRQPCESLQQLLVRAAEKLGSANDAGSNRILA